MSSVMMLSKSQLEAIVSRPGNNACVDCGALGPNWVTTTYGALLCLNCAGVHRSFGVEVSFVRSLRLDAWTREQERMMLVSSNEKVNDFFKASGESSEGHERYLTGTAAKLKKLVRGLKDGQEEAELTLDLSEGEVEAIEQLKAAYKFRVERERKQNDDASSGRRPWVPDSSSSSCMVCGKSFSIFVRRHHCRNCGQLVCSACAPRENSKPIPQLGYCHPVRHCRLCFQSLGIDWASQDALTNFQ